MANKYDKTIGIYYTSRIGFQQFNRIKIAKVRETKTLYITTDGERIKKRDIYSYTLKNIEDEYQLLESTYVNAYARYTLYHLANKTLDKGLSTLSNDELIEEVENYINKLSKQLDTLKSLG